MSTPGVPCGTPAAFVRAVFRGRQLECFADEWLDHVWFHRGSDQDDVRHTPLTLHDFDEVERSAWRHSTRQVKDDAQGITRHG